MENDITKTKDEGNIWKQSIRCMLMQLVLVEVDSPWDYLTQHLEKSEYLHSFQPCKFTRWLSNPIQYDTGLYWSYIISW